MALEKGPPSVGLRCWGSIYWELTGNGLRVRLQGELVARFIMASRIKKPLVSTSQG